MTEPSENANRQNILYPNCEVKTGVKVYEDTVLIDLFHLFPL